MIISNTAHCGNNLSITPNIVLSSHGKNSSFLRSPKDLENFLDIFDIDQGKAKVIIEKHPLKVLVKAFKRRTAKGAVFVEKLSDVEPDADPEDPKESS